MQAVFTAIGNFFTALLAKIVGFAQWLLAWPAQVFEDTGEFLKDLVCWVLESVLDLVVSALSALDFSGLQGYSNAWGSLPGEVLNVLGLMGLGEAMGIIVAAITIRLILQLIPFTRLGS